MVQIFVGNKKLKLFKNTTLNIELNNALFSKSNIEGDITYSFNIPVQGNEQALELAHLPQANSSPLTDCTVQADKTTIISGKLVIQSIKNDSISIAIVLNSYPEGFAKRKLTENTTTVFDVSATPDAQSAGWKKLVKNSHWNQDIKFAPFINEDAYGDNNENFGFWNGNTRDKVINAVFYDANNEILISDKFPFSQIENKVFELQEESDDGTGENIVSTSTEYNQIAFAPQIRLASILKHWCENAGYEFVNHLGKDYNQTFLQSVKLLDGTVAQYQYQEPALTIETTAQTLIDKKWYYCNSYWLNGQSQNNFVHNGKVWLPTAGWWQIFERVEFEYPKSQKKHKCIESLAFATKDAITWLNQLGMNTPDIAAPFVIAALEKVNYSELPISIIISIGDLVWDADEGDFDSSNILYNAEFSQSKVYDYNNKKCVSFNNHIYVPANATNSGLKFAAFIKTPYGYKNVESAKLTIKLDELGNDSTQGGFNIFKKSFSIAECCPDITNSAFIQNILKSLGLCYFISKLTKKIEIVPYSLLENAGALDLSEYVLVRETETSIPEETLQKFKLKPLTEESFDEENRLPNEPTTFPDQYLHHEKVVLLEASNTMYRAAIKESEEENFVEEWEEFSGNQDTIDVGSGEETVTESSVVIPHQRFISGNTNITSGQVPMQLAVANFEMESPMYNQEKKTEIILTQFRGRHKMKVGDNEFYADVMLPVWYKNFALKTLGSNSLGENYMRKVLELENRKTIKYKLYLPLAKLKEVENLLRPDTNNPNSQTRFIFINGVKSVPKKISFQIDNNNSERVLCEIETVKAN